MPSLLVRTSFSHHNPRVVGSSPTAAIPAKSESPMLRKSLVFAAAAAVAILTVVGCGTGPSEPMPPGDMPMQVVADSLDRG